MLYSSNKTHAFTHARSAFILTSILVAAPLVACSEDSKDDECDCKSGSNCSQEELTACQTAKCDCATGSNCSQEQLAACQAAKCDCTTGSNCSQEELAACQAPKCDCTTGSNCSQEQLAACQAAKCDCTTGSNCSQEELAACQANECPNDNYRQLADKDCECNKYMETTTHTCMPGIASVDDLKSVRDGSGSYVLVSDINVTQPFNDISISLYGNGHKISSILTVTDGNTSSGVFEWADGASIQNVVLDLTVNVAGTIGSQYSSKNANWGGLIGNGQNVTLKKITGKVSLVGQVTIPAANNSLENVYIGALAANLVEDADIEDIDIEMDFDFRCDDSSNIVKSNVNAGLIGSFSGNKVTISNVTSRKLLQLQHNIKTTQLNVGGVLGYLATGNAVDGVKVTNLYSIPEIKVEIVGNHNPKHGFIGGVIGNRNFTNSDTSDVTASGYIGKITYINTRNDLDNNEWVNFGGVVGISTHNLENVAAAPTFSVSSKNNNAIFNIGGILGRSGQNHLSYLNHKNLYAQPSLSYISIEGDRSKAYYAGIAAASDAEGGRPDDLETISESFANIDFGFIKNASSYDNKLRLYGASGAKNKVTSVVTTSRTYKDIPSEKQELITRALNANPIGGLTLTDCHFDNSVWTTAENGSSVVDSEETNTSGFEPGNGAPAFASSTSPFAEWTIQAGIPEPSSREVYYKIRELIQ